ncbi:unnamed protein product [Leptosia nina]|uniref:Uncharacterized protein n=1 Tax=Leptosia nina TaxID=320188 RepID=A0AAV1JZD8_9NEOP
MVKSKVDVGQGNKKPQDLPELETNSVINYDANSLGLDGEYNNNEVQSKEMNSKISYEECQNFSTTSFEGSNADEVVHQLENTILSITNISAEEIPTGIPSLYPTLESICPILEDLKLSIASLNQNSQDSELNLSDISENSVELIFGKPLHDLEEHVSVLNHILFESVKDHSGLEDVQRLGILVKPLHELHTTYQILQENVISQYESLSTLHGDNNIASIKEILQSCVLLVEEQHGLEVVDDISTLEDISCIKTSADSVCSDALQLADELQVGLEDSREIIEQDKNDDLASGTTSIQAGDIIKNIEASIETKEDLRNSSFEVCDAETMFMEPPISSALPCDITTADVVLTPEMEINNIVHEQITDIQIDLTQQPEEKMQMCDNRVELEDSLKCEIKNDTNESLENNNLHETNTKILSEKSSADQCNVDLNKEEIETKVKTKQPSKVAEPVETFDEMHTNDGLNIVSDMPEAIQCEMDDEIEKEATINVQKLQASGDII